MFYKFNFLPFRLIWQIKWPFSLVLPKFMNFPPKGKKMKKKWRIERRRGYKFEGRTLEVKKKLECGLLSAIFGLCGKNWPGQGGTWHFFASLWWKCTATTKMYTLGVASPKSLCFHLQYTSGESCVVSIIHRLDATSKRLIFIQ